MEKYFSKGGALYNGSDRRLFNRNGLFAIGKDQEAAREWLEFSINKYAHSGGGGASSREECEKKPSFYKEQLAVRGQVKYTQTILS
jgi:hypothetical protein